MRVRKLIYFLAVVAMILVTMSDARRSGGRSSSRSGSRSRSSYSRSSYSRSYSGGYGRGNYYTGLVIIAGPGGTYYQGYGNQCPNGCAVNGRCGTVEECTVSTAATIVFFSLFFCAFCCIAGTFCTIFCSANG